MTSVNGQMTSLENTTKDIKDMLKISNNKVYNRLGSKKKADKPVDQSIIKGSLLYLCVYLIASQSGEYNV